MNDFIRVFCWNIDNAYNKERLDCINYYAQKCDLIVLLEASSNLIESFIPGFSLIQPFQLDGRKWIRILKNDASTNFTIRRVKNLFNERIQVASIIKPGVKDFHLYCLHLHSKVSKDKISQIELNIDALKEIESFQSTTHDRSVLLGDFNHNPFEEMLASKGGFNALPNKSVVKLLSQSNYKGKKKLKYYNPMWNFLGDSFGNNNHSGTFNFHEQYNTTSSHLNWNLLDQVIISEKIVDSIDPGKIQIITNYDNLNNTISLLDANQFLKTGQMINSDYSDHLPIYFEINLNNI